MVVILLEFHAKTLQKKLVLVYSL